MKASSSSLNINSVEEESQNMKNKNNTKQNAETQIVSPKIMPDVYTYAAILSACEKSSNGQLALELYYEMKTLYGYRPNDIICGTTISACRKSGLAIEALENTQTWLRNDKSFSDEG